MLRQTSKQDICYNIVLPDYVKLTRVLNASIKDNVNKRKVCFTSQSNYILSIQNLS